MHASDDSGDELKVKFAGEIHYKVKGGTPLQDLKRQHNAVMEVNTYSSKPYCRERARSRIS